MIGAGRHEVRVASHGLAKSGQKGTPCLAVVFEDDVGERITYYGYLTDAALEYTVRALETMGWRPAEHDWRIDVLNGTDLLVGNRVEIVVEEEEYEGKVRAKVRFVNEIGGGVGERMAPDEAAAFASDLRARILSARGPAPSTKPGAAASHKARVQQAVRDFAARTRPAPAQATVPATIPDPLAEGGFDPSECPF